MKRTPIKSKSAKQADLETSTIGPRRAWIEYGTPCQAGCGQPATECHEIPAGHGRRSVAMSQPDAQLLLCHTCHSEYQGAPYAEQISLRVQAMIRAVNHCHGSNKVTAEDVRAYL
jgi:hypothetical protein